MLMAKFDLDRRGSINLADLFGNAILISKKRPNGKLSSRASLSTDCLGSDLDTTSTKRFISEASGLDEKLAVVAVDILGGVSRHSGVLRTSATHISSIEFRHLLKDLDCGLNKSEVKMLERKYMHVPTGSISIVAFLEDFKKLGRKRQQHLQAIGERSEYVSGMQSAIIASEVASLGGGDRIEFKHVVRMTLNSTGDDVPITSLCATPVDTEDSYPSVTGRRKGSQCLVEDDSKDVARLS